MQQRRETDPRAMVKRVQCVEYKRNQIAFYNTTELSKGGEKLGVGFVERRKEVDRPLGKTPRHIRLASENLGPDVLHRFIRDEATLVKEVGQPVLLNRFRFCLVAEVGQSLACDVFNVRLFL